VKGGAIFVLSSECRLNGKLRRHRHRKKSITESQLGEVDTRVREAIPPTPLAAPKDSFRLRRCRIIGFTILLLGYAALSQYSASSDDSHAKAVGAALSVAPVLSIAVVLLWWTSWRIAALLVAALSGLLLYRNWPLIERNYEWADLAQQCGIYGLVALVFARSLFGSRIPLCTQLAQQMYDEYTTTEGVYLRRATAAWAIFYGLMTVAVLGLFFTVSLPQWSLFVNFVAWGLMVLAALVDLALRRRLLPRHREGGILTLIRRALSG
jgi:uncharacterized membrane protein